VASGDTAVCVCDEGYTLDGPTQCVPTPSGWPSRCEDVDCGAHGTCEVNAVGTPYCACDAGYYADGLSCVAGSACTAGGTEVGWWGLNFATGRGLGQYHGVIHRNNRAYVVRGEAFEIWDVSNLASPQLLSDTASAVDWAGGFALVADHLYLFDTSASQGALHIYDVSTPAAPSFVQTIPLPGERYFWARAPGQPDLCAGSYG
jgi:hypothetical protein